MKRDIYLIEKAQKKAFPLNTLIEITFKCNLRCLHCYVVRDYSKKEMTTAEIFYALRQLRDNGCLYLSLSGGEIFMRPDFFDIARYARKLSFGLRLFTNGTLIDEKIADKIKELRPLQVETSIYGFEKTHDRITRVKSSFNKTINAIRLLRNRKIGVLAKITLMRHNVQEFWELRKYITRLGAQACGVGSGLMISSCDDGDCAPLRYRLTDAQLISHLRQELKECRRLGVRSFPKRVRNNEILCLAGVANCNINPYGQVGPCNQIRLGGDSNLRDNSLKKIWVNNKYMRELRSLRESDRKDCSKCDLRPFCHMCPGMALLEQGSLLAKLPEACRIAKIRKEIYNNM